MSQKLAKKPVPARQASQATTLEAQAEIHRRTRKAHHTEIAEDYCEVIARLIDAHGEARAVDIARTLGVTHVTVVRTVARLQKAGLVTSQPYRAIFLTDAGRQLADDSRRRHDAVVRFLIALGVSPRTAETDAEGIEHHVSAETLEAFENFTRRKTRR
ncbi:MAG: manganese-binding transcriptional regulator MntR [Phycisphaerae bacterium]